MTTSELVSEIGTFVDGFRATDVGNANRLVAVADGKLRYVRQWQKFIVYREGVWIVDTGNVLAEGLAKQVAQKMFEFAVRPNIGVDARDALLMWAKQSESQARLSSMLQAARDIPGVLVEHSELNQHHGYLNVLNGTIDLRTGVLLAHDPEHLITRQAPVIYDVHAEASLWHRCLQEWQPDRDMRLYLQEKIGAGATGYVTEEFDIHHGSGGNGKGKFFGTVMHVLGPYAVVPHKSLITVQRYEQHETVMAELFGARIAVAAETDRDERLDEEKIKELTSDDQLRGRRMREDPWYFDPSHCLHLHTNHKPLVRGTDEGIWRRVKLIPWEKSFNDNPDLELKEKLRAEASGVLNWIAYGAHRWLSQGRGFTIPILVDKATRAYRAEADPFQRFLTIATADSPETFTPTAFLHEACMVWRTHPSHEERPPDATEKALATRLKRHYHSAKQRINGHEWRGFKGITLIPAYVAEVERVRREEPDRLKPSMADLVPSGREN